MIIGIGTDIIEIERIKKALDSKGFLKKCFTKKEIEMFFNEYKNYNSLAGNFATKEAVSKVLGTGFNKVQPIEIEVLRLENGKPYVNLYGNAKDIANDLNIKEILVSISHDRDKAISFVIAQ